MFGRGMFNRVAAGPGKQTFVMHKDDESPRMEIIFAASCSVNERLQRSEII